LSLAVAVQRESANKSSYISRCSKLGSTYELCRIAERFIGHIVRNETSEIYTII
jgi:hypothetical protein